MTDGRSDCHTDLLIASYRARQRPLTDPSAYITPSPSGPVPRPLPAAIGSIVEVEPVGELVLKA